MPFVLLQNLSGVSLRRLAMLSNSNHLSIKFLLSVISHLSGSLVHDLDFLVQLMTSVLSRKISWHRWSSLVPRLVVLCCLNARHCFYCTLALIVVVRQKDREIVPKTSCLGSSFHYLLNVEEEMVTKCPNTNWALCWSKGQISSIRGETHLRNVKNW